MWSIRPSTWGNGIVWTRRSGAPSWAGAVLSSSSVSRNSEQYRTVRSPSSHTRGVVASLYGGGRWTACALAHLSAMPCAYIPPSRRRHSGGLPPGLYTGHLAETREGSTHGSTADQRPQRRPYAEGRPARQAHPRDQRRGAPLVRSPTQHRQNGTGQSDAEHKVRGVSGSADALPHARRGWHRWTMMPTHVPSVRGRDSVARRGPSGCSA